MCKIDFTATIILVFFLAAASLAGTLFDSTYEISTGELINRSKMNTSFESIDDRIETLEDSSSAADIELDGTQTLNALPYFSATSDPAKLKSSPLTYDSSSDTFTLDAPFFDFGDNLLIITNATLRSNTAGADGGLKIQDDNITFDATGDVESLILDNEGYIYINHSAGQSTEDAIYRYGGDYLYYDGYPIAHVQAPATGEILYFDGTNWQALANGSAGEALISTGTTVEWGAVSSDFDGLTDTNLTGTTTGDVLYYDGSDWVNLGIGADGEALKSNGTTVEWGEVSTTPPDKVYEFPAGSFDYPNAVTSEPAPLDYENGSDLRMYYQAFDDTTDEVVLSSFVLPDDYDNTNGITVEYHGFSDVTTGDVIMSIEFIEWDTGQDWNQSWGTTYTNTISATGTSGYNMYGTRNIITSFEAKDVIFIRIYRDADNVSDNMSGDFKMTHARIIVGRQ